MFLFQLSNLQFDIKILASPNKDQPRLYSLLLLLWIMMKMQRCRVLNSAVKLKSKTKYFSTLVQLRLLVLKDMGMLIDVEGKRSAVFWRSQMILMNVFFFILEIQSFIGRDVSFQVKIPFFYLNTSSGQILKGFYQEDLEKERCQFVLDVL